MEKFCAYLPKVELHAHLIGSIEKESFDRIQQKLKIRTLNPLDYPCECDLDSLFEQFKLAHQIVNTFKTLSIAMKDVIEDFYMENVNYVELRSTPRSGLDFNKVEYVRAVVGNIKGAFMRHPEMVVKYLVSIDRTQSYEEQRQNIDLAIDFHKIHPTIVVGVDLSGNPTKGRWYKDLFILARSHGLKVTLHCAANTDIHEIMSMLDFRPDRIAHGCFIYPESKLWARLKEYYIPVECCLTSNMRCGLVPSIFDHHLVQYAEEGMPFVICTDDKGLFESNLSQEYAMASSIFPNYVPVVLSATYNAIKYAFCDEMERKYLEQELATFEGQHNVM